jgi:type I restriction enzyme S subunit
MEYIKTPTEISLNEVIKKDFVLAPSSLTRVIIKNKNTQYLRDLISFKKKGQEVGSSAYITKSNKFFIRTRAVNKHSWILYKKSKEGIIPINPLFFKKYDLRKGDVLLCKDSNIGECAIIHSEEFKDDFAISGGFIKLRFTKNTYYIFAMLKSAFFKEQLLSTTARGSTIKHARDMYLDCVIPFPASKSRDKVISSVEKLTREIIRNEANLLENHNKIFSLIAEEVKSNQKRDGFSYNFPFLEDVSKTLRLDAGIYSEDYSYKVFMIKNYSNGCSDLYSLGFKAERGTSLEIKGLGTRIDSEISKEGFYELVIPTNISVHGTVMGSSYIGTKIDLRTVKKGDIVFGGEGFEKGRTFVVCEDIGKIATNYHGIRIFKDKINLFESIFVRCFLAYWREQGMIDYIGVGGSGGHCAPEYFNYLLIPNFPQQIKQQIVKLYYNTDKENPGIYQLDQLNRRLKMEVKDLIDKIVTGAL